MSGSVLEREKENKWMWQRSSGVETVGRKKRGAILLTPLLHILIEFDGGAGLERAMLVTGWDKDEDGSGSE